MAKKVSYAVYSDFVLRVPGLPVSNLSTIPEKRDKLDSFIRNQWTNPLINNAIWLASPDLAAGIDDLISRKLPFTSAVASSFLNYFTRFCTRPTPFGLFAGVVSGKINVEPELKMELLSSDKGLLSCRLDMEYLLAQVQNLSGILEFRKNQIYSPSSGLYRLGNQYRFISTSISKSGNKNYRIESFDDHPLIEPLLQFCREGKKYDELISFFTEEEYSKKEAEDFINELIEMQVLVNRLEPVLTGMEYGRYLIDRLEKDGMNEEGGHHSKLLEEQIRILQSPMSPSEYDSKRLIIQKLADQGSVPYNASKLIQGDFMRSAKSVMLPERISNKIILGIRIMKAMSERNHFDSLRDFKAHFARRFNSRKVPILHVLDQEFGLGLKGPLAQQDSDSSALLDDLVNYGFPGKKKSNREGAVKPTREGLYYDSSTYQILNANDIRLLKINQGLWPKQMYAICSLFGDSDNPEIYIQLAAKGNPVYLMGRFGFLPDAGLESMLKTCIKDEIAENPDDIFADIIHLPENRTGNILQRPSCYPYEIPFLTQSLLPQDKQIDLNDILVSVENDKVILTHRLNGLNIIPRLSNAHNYAHGQLAVYEFLVKCGKQTGSDIYSLPEDGLTKFGFIPGLKYGDLVFRLPQWKLNLSDLKKNMPKEKEDRFNRLKLWVQKNKMPDQVILKEGDRHLFVNWQNQNLVECCWDIIKRKSTAHFELFPYTSGSPVEENGSSLANQIVLCFHQTN
ncbi:MAG: lantibiotic dehydratase family protein [Bacteroidota bacterium]|nr:lantibiotic dehydratase family protein [Bacteroidota bacterium]